jgi:hypothetical protein
LKPTVSAKSSVTCLRYPFQSTAGSENLVGQVCGGVGDWSTLL